MISTLKDEFSFIKRREPNTEYDKICAMEGYLYFQYSYLFQPNEFTGEFQGISLPGEGIGEYDIAVKRPDGTQVDVTLAMVINPYPSSIIEREYINKALDLGRDKTVRVEVIRWNNKIPQSDLVYIENDDIAELLLREGYLVASTRYISNLDSSKIYGEKRQYYEEVERQAIWAKFD